jgi:hypothetical protein
VIIKANHPPIAPIINGSLSGHKNGVYYYTAMSTDPDNDSIQYIFNWGDGNITTTEFLPNGTITTQSHEWLRPGKYVITVKAFDNQTESGAEEITVLIDALYTGTIGYLLDLNNDQIYDKFHSNVTGNETITEYKDGQYLIDSNGDGNWDYSFTSSGGLIVYEKVTAKGIPGFELLLILCAMAFIFLWKRKRI